MPAGAERPDHHLGANAVAGGALDVAAIDSGGGAGFLTGGALGQFFAEVGFQRVPIAVKQRRRLTLLRLGPGNVVPGWAGDSGADVIWLIRQLGEERAPRRVHAVGVFQPAGMHFFNKQGIGPVKETRSEEIVVRNAAGVIRHDRGSSKEGAQPRTSVAH